MSSLRIVLSDLALSIMGRLKNITGREDTHDLFLARLSLFLAGILTTVLMLIVVYFMMVIVFGTFLFEPSWVNLLGMLLVLIFVSGVSLTISGEKVAKTYDKLNCNSITTESWFG